MSSSEHILLVRCLRHVLRPVARFCLQRAVRIQDLLEAVKQALIELAAEDLTARGENITVSKLSVMTGIHRRDVTRLSKGDSEEKYGGDLLARVIEKWRSHSSYSTRGQPKLLQVEGKDSEFSELVSSISKNINTYTVLSELERVGVIERIEDKVKLLKFSLQINNDAVQGFYLLGNDSEDMLKAVSENIFKNPKIRHLHIKTVYDNIALCHLDEAKQWILEQGKLFHHRVREYLAKYDVDLNPDLKQQQGGGRVAVCAFSLTEKRDEPEEKKQ